MEQNDSISSAQWRLRDSEHKPNRPALDSAVEDTRSNTAPLGKGAMQMHAEPTRKTLETESAIIEVNSLKLGETEAIEPALAPKAREPWLTAILQPPEEPSIGLVEPLQSPALQGNRGCRGVAILASPVGERLALIDIGAGYARLAVGIDAFFEARIVELSLILKDRFERAMLPFCRQKAVAKREVHSGR